LWLLLAATRLSDLRGRAARASCGRDLSRDGRREAAAGGLLYRRPAAGAALTAVPARDAGGDATLVVRRDGLSLAQRGHRQTTVQTRGDGERIPHSRRRPTVAHEVPVRHGSR